MTSYHLIDDQGIHYVIDGDDPMAHLAEQLRLRSRPNFYYEKIRMVRALGVV